MSEHFTASHRDELLKENRKLKERIKRLEEAGDALASWTIPNGNSHVDWRKAKEAKP